MTMTPVDIPVQFERFILRQDENVPNDGDLRGSIAITRDTRVQGLAHKVIVNGQKFAKFLSGSRSADPYVSHGIVILEGPLEGERKMLMAHSAFTGIVTSNRDYTADPDVTEVLIWRPEDERIREVMARFADQAAYTKPEYATEEKNKAWENRRIAPFSYGDMFRAPFHRQGGPLNPRGRRRLAYATADLLRGDQILDQKGEPRSMLCCAFALFTLQASILTARLTVEQQEALLYGADGELRERDELAELLLRGINRQAVEEEASGALQHIADAFAANRVCHLNTRWTLSSKAVKRLNQVTLPGAEEI